MMLFTVPISSVKIQIIQKQNEQRLTNKNHNENIVKVKSQNVIYML